MNDEPPRNRSDIDIEISLRPEEPGDEPLLFELYASTRVDELAMTGWDTPTRNAFLNMQFKAMRQGYAAMFPRGQFSIILADGKSAGRLVVNRTSDEIHLADIVVAPDRRNRGIGTRILSGLIEEAAKTRRPVRLQVIKNSRAIGLYRRLGFHTTSAADIYELMEWRRDAH
jgi:ribosomal protein S18 acetylase RimI-like enzyme